MAIDAPAARRQSTARGRVLGWASPSWALLVGIAVLAGYLLLLPFIARTWRATGDEPHYLLAAHSLVYDGDFDLANNYDRFDYLAFYFSKDIDRQIRLDPAGRQILNHQLGLPVIIAPIYALGGRLGVLFFQAILGGVLAAITFKLAVAVGRDEPAALLATLVVAFSPPLLMYNYLVYPELLGALLTTVILYYAITQNRPTPVSAVLVIGALLLLPWLNRRFVPLTVLMLLLVVWAWRRMTTAPGSGAGLMRRVLAWVGRPSPAGLVALLVSVCSVALLFWFTSRLSDPVRLDIYAPPDAEIFWNRLGRGIGWLVDQQKGLFIVAPVYVLMLWGILPLFYHSLKARNRAGLVLAPFLLSLGVTAVAGGFWVPWELGPRFLVVALPALAPLLALAWRTFHRFKIWMVLALVLLALSLMNSLLIIQNPELPYKSSLPLYYAQKTGIPFTEYLPDLAGYARIFVSRADPTTHQVVTENGRQLLFAPAGHRQNVVQSEPLHQLPFGHYRLAWPLRVDPGLPPTTELLRISAKFLGGGLLFNQIITADRLPSDGTFGRLDYAFVNPNIDRWRTPIVFQAVSTGQSNIWGQDIIFTPQPFFAWILPYSIMLVLVAAALFNWLWLRLRQPIDRPALALFTVPHRLGWALVALLAVAGLGYFIYQINQTSRTYDVAQLYHFVGRAIADPQAEDGSAWLVDPATDPPQKAVHGPFDFYDAGQYRVTFRLKTLRPVEPEQEIARLQVNATANLEELATQPILGKHFSRPNLYHDMVLTIANPRRQALSFEVHYLGVTPLVIDGITVTKVGS